MISSALAQAAAVRAGTVTSGDLIDMTAKINHAQSATECGNVDEV